MLYILKYIATLVINAANCANGVIIKLKMDIITSLLFDADILSGVFQK